jgi:hypothetical protein
MFYFLFQTLFGSTKYLKWLKKNDIPYRRVAGHPHQEFEADKLNIWGVFLYRSKSQQWLYAHVKAMGHC